MKYTSKILKKLGLSYKVTHNEETWAPEIIIENNNGDFMRYKTTMIDIEDNNMVDHAIDKFLVECRKEKLQRLNEI